MARPAPVVCMPGMRFNRSFRGTKGSRHGYCRCPWVPLNTRTGSFGFNEDDLELALLGRQLSSRIGRGFIKCTNLMISNCCRWTSFGLFTNWCARHWLPKYQPKKQRLINDCVSFAWAPGLTMLRKVTRGALIRRFIRNIEIPRSRPKLGRAAERRHAGWPHISSRGNGSTISGSF